jgi:hypothetical protein
MKTGGIIMFFLQSPNASGLTYYYGLGGDAF